MNYIDGDGWKTVSQKKNYKNWIDLDDVDGRNILNNIFEGGTLVKVSQKSNKK